MRGHFVGAAAALTVAFAPVAIGLSAPNAQADPGQDQQYLGMVHSNGVGAADDLLLTYAQQYCAGTVDMGLVGNLLGQIGWFNKSGVYVVQTAASRVYCPEKIVQPPTPNVIINRY